MKYLTYLPLSFIGSPLPKNDSIMIDWDLSLFWSFTLSIKIFRVAFNRIKSSFSTLRSYATAFFTKYYSSWERFINFLRSMKGHTEWRPSHCLQSSLMQQAASMVHLSLQQNLSTLWPATHLMFGAFSPPLPRRASISSSPTANMILYCWFMLRSYSNDSWDIKKCFEDFKNKEGF